MLNEVRNRPRAFLLDRRRGPFAVAFAPQAGLFHQASHALFSDADAIVLQSGVDARRPVGASRPVVYLADFFSQHRVFWDSFGRPTVPPGVVATAANIKDALAEH